MKLRPLGSALVFAIAIGLQSAQAATVVYNDSGNIGEFRATNTGVSAAGTATIVFAVPSATSQMNTVNGLFIAPELAAINAPVTMLVTPAGGDDYSLSLVPTTYHKTIGNTPGSQAVLDFSLTTGVIPTTLPAFFNVSGPVTGLTANLDPTFDFSQFASGVGKINLTFTATAFSGASNFASFIATPGATATGNGSFSQAVPEPATLAMLGIGLCGLVVFRRLYRRR